MRSVTPVGATDILVTFHGVRGSTPCHGPSTVRYGGNTSCVSIQVPGENPIVCDMGTGLRYFGEQWQQSGRPFVGTALLTHLHWDHVQGIPFFPPIFDASTEVDVYGPVQEDGVTLQDAMKAVVKPPTFPVGLDILPGRYRFHDVLNADFATGSVSVKSRVVPHIGPTVGYRVEWAGKVITYISDHQQNYDGSFGITNEVRELAEGADLLIHDSQYTAEEFRQKYYWGHCTPEFAMSIARSCGVRRLALFHHDPTRTDDALDSLASCGSAGVEVFAARENQTVVV